MAQELLHAGSTLRFARGQAVLVYYLPPLRGWCFAGLNVTASIFISLVGMQGQLHKCSTSSANLRFLGSAILKIPFDKAAAVLLYPWPARYVSPDFPFPVLINNIGFDRRFGSENSKGCSLGHFYFYDIKHI